MKRVVIAGATGYLGRYLTAEFRKRGWRTRAIVRDLERASLTGLPAHELVEAEATRPESLALCFDDADLVVSCMGITRQRDGLRYQEVDYQANANLLEAALGSGVPKFCYIHVFGAARMKGGALVDAKETFAAQLRAAPIDSTIISPNGYFSDMGDFLKMARGGRIWLFGDGGLRLNPIHGGDLAVATAEAIDDGVAELEVGGPEVFTHDEIAELAFQVLGRPVRITHLPDVVRRATLATLPHITPQRIHGPVQFFLSAMGMDMVAPTFGTHRLRDHFVSLAGA